MAERWMARTGALLLLSAPVLYEVLYDLGLRGCVPTLYPPTEWPEPDVQLSWAIRFHDIPLPHFASLHLAALAAFAARRWTLVPLVALALFVPGYLLAIPYLAGPLNALLWFSALLPEVVVGSLLAIERDLEKAAGVARMSMALLLAQTHLLIWSSWEGHPLVAGAWAGLFGALLWAGGEMIASRRPGSSASAWRPCPLPSRRTSWRRA